ncbi:MAG: COR domain-containing protein, partial [Bacteroidota bacterium]
VKIEGLERLVGLNSLNLQDCQIDQLNETLLRQASLEYLNLKGNPLSSIPKEILHGVRNEKAYQDNDCLEDLRQWVASLEEGKVLNQDIKLVICGNGGVGKSNLCDQLLGLPFEDRWLSTHGIRIEKLADFYPGKDQRPINVHFWDFGGQEVYHGVHRLFMRSRAVYLIVWDEETEDTEWATDPHNGELYRNHKMAYWAELIRASSPDSPIILVQNKVDGPQDGYRQIKEEELPDFLNVQFRCHGSAKTGYGIDQLRATLGAALQELPEYHQEIPTAWQAVRQNILARLAMPPQSREKKLSLDAFQALCLNKDVLERSIPSLLRYLHRTGIVFYQEEFFKDQILLDQQWALDAIYAALDRKSTFYRLMQRLQGRFLYEDLCAEWSKYSEADHKLFFDFMKGSYLVFEIINERGEEEYILPQFLAETPENSVLNHWKDQGETSRFFAYNHPFLLSYATMQAFLVRVGKRAQLNHIWRQGVWISLGNSHAKVEADFSNRLIRLQAHGPEREYLLDAIRNAFDEIHASEKDIESLVSSDGEQYASLSEIRKMQELGSPMVFACFSQQKLMVEKLTWAFTRNKKAKLDKLPEVRQPALVPKAMEPLPPQVHNPKVFISYSHGEEDEGRHSKQVAKLADILTKAGVVVWFDQYAKPKLTQRWHTWMEERLEEADYILVVCSESYHRRFSQKEEPGVGRGVTWEGALVKTYLYNGMGFNRRFIPILFEETREEWIPTPLQGYPFYRIGEQFQELYAHLTKQNQHKPPPLGRIVRPDQISWEGGEDEA